MNGKAWLKLANEAWQHEDVHRSERKRQGLLDSRDMADNGNWVERVPSVRPF